NYLISSHLKNSNCLQNKTTELISSWQYRNSNDLMHHVLIPSKQARFNPLNLTGSPPCSFNYPTPTPPPPTPTPPVSDSVTVYTVHTVQCSYLPSFCWQLSQ
uniref:Uncharacterized protein n=1 Tax=Seriola dumerili TaxID=41447 RepID=A0A3B4UT95_SERDU